MGMSTKNIMFFSDEIIIIPHTATKARHIGRRVSLRQFSRGKPISLEQVLETGEYIATNLAGEFIHGPEVYTNER